MTKSEENCHIGIDVSKNELDIYILPENSHKSYTNTPKGIQAIKKKLLANYPNAKVVLEATGGYEKRIAKALNESGMEVCIANPRKIRDFAKALGKLAKTDKIDAKVIAVFAEKLQPTARPLSSKNQAILAELSARRRQLVDMIVMEKNRLDKADGDIKKSINKILKILEKEVATVEKKLSSIIHEDDHYANIFDILTSVPGIGEKVATALIAYLPELGTTTGKQIAALAGLAPFNRDSGTFKGIRSIWGGRGPVRAAIYMAALVATKHNPMIRAFYRRLLAAGKPKKLALTACMRKLIVCTNAMIKNNQPWQMCEN